MDDACAIDADHVADPILEQDPRARDAGRAHAEEDDPHVLEALAHDVRCIDQRCERDNGRAVLIVMKDGDIELVPETPLDLEAHRRGDVLQVDASEAGRDRARNGHELVGRVRARADWVRVDIGELLEEHRLAFHHRQRGFGTDVSEPKHRRPVRQDRHRVLLDRQVPDALGGVCDRPRDAPHAGRVRHREVVPGLQRVLRGD